jgi:hypothetical protein
MAVYMHFQTSKTHSLEPLFSLRLYTEQCPGYGMDPETIDTVRVGLQVVEGLFLSMGESTGVHTPRSWPEVQARVFDELARRSLAEILDTAIDEQDHLFRNYGARSRSKASWAEKLADMVQEMSKTLCERLLTESFLKTLCQWCESPLEKDRLIQSGDNFNTA